MKRLLEQLTGIYEVLEQVHAITTNQGTVLLQPKEDIEEESKAIELIDEMITYKDQLIAEIEAREAAFDQAYLPFKGKITRPEDVNCFQEAVGRILTMKQAIVEAERNNIMIMQNFSKRKSQKLEIKKQAGAVAEAYKKHQLKT